ncbi:pyridoxal 5'-phosphate synthase glutaminase subunit PdxT [Brachybacterium sp. J144]|uniref:pyridoxal 5'-phosphate synthase glutaminase subunit PdxT n=1 Tax=Brachybacterium sp. J144 TaxID=3116487 RepID=UPI002E76EED0|nr:pyridoxal 5'-phosphate synthase glutaminase subunit PdxT [Brachybacterium sp. J144]MEE1650345.1 pyridoxal 5'-phosphate synthase glutaminase subunit PdxT [Brachybacterium sp. J144]
MPSAGTLSDGAPGTGLRIGVLALQGDVREHRRVLTALGAQVETVRRPAELAAVDGLVIPGGESTVIDRLARLSGLHEPLRAAIAGGLPVLGTCAGLIQLAERLRDGGPGQETFGGLDATVRRNAFGRQTESFETDLVVPDLEGPPVRAVFIRAPLIEELGPASRAVATLPDGRIVGARQGAVLGLAFHPESAGETRFHELFLESVRRR